MFTALHTILVRVTTAAVRTSWVWAGGWGKRIPTETGRLQVSSWTTFGTVKAQDRMIVVPLQGVSRE